MTTETEETAHPADPHACSDRIADVMQGWLCDACPGWAEDVPMPANTARHVALLEAQCVFLMLAGHSTSDHIRALHSLRGNAPMFMVEDALARIRLLYWDWHRRGALRYRSDEEGE